MALTYTVKINFKKMYTFTYNVDVEPTYLLWSKPPVSWNHIKKPTKSIDSIHTFFSYFPLPSFIISFRFLVYFFHSYFLLLRFLTDDHYAIELRTYYRKFFVSSLLSFFLLPQTISLALTLFLRHLSLSLQT